MNPEEVPRWVGELGPWAAVLLFGLRMLLERLAPAPRPESSARLERLVRELERRFEVVTLDDVRKTVERIERMARSHDREDPTRPGLSIWSCRGCNAQPELREALEILRSLRKESP